MLTRDRLVEHTFRIAASLIFVVAGLGHVGRPEQMVAQLSHAPFGAWALGIAPARTLVLLAGPPLIAGGLALMLGLRTRLAALTLLALLVPITLTTHVGYGGGVGPLFKNLALAGALLHFAHHGHTVAAGDRS